MPKLNKIYLPKTCWYGVSASSLSWAKKDEEGDWLCLYNPETCRTRLNDYWNKTTKNPSYPYLPGGSLGITLDQENTNIFFCLVGGADNPLADDVSTNIKKLNRIEKKYGISLTTFEFVDVFSSYTKTFVGLGVVFTGDKDWQSNLWKITLYSFLLKAACSPRFLSSSKEGIKTYSKIYRKYKDKLLPKVKTVFNEVLDYTSFTRVHASSGFVSICSGDNPVMAKILLEEEENAG